MAPDINNEEIKTACNYCKEQVVFYFFTRRKNE